MSPAARTGLRATRRALWHALAVVLVLMALGAVAAAALLPLLERHPERVESWLGQRIGHPVAFDDLDTAWTRRGPRLRLEGLRIGAGDEAVQVGAAEVLVAQYAGLLPGRALTELRLHNLHLVLERDARGRWRARGLPGQQAGGDPFQALERLGELQVIAGSLTIAAPSVDFHATVPRIDLRLQVGGNRVRAAARAWMRPDGAPLDVAAKFERDSGDTEVYAGVDGARLDAWLPLLQAAGVPVDRAGGRLEAWAGLRDARIERLTARVELDDVGLRAARDDDATPAGVGFDEVEAALEWRRTTPGWRLSVPALEISSGAASWRTSALEMQAGNGYALAADRIEAAPLLQLLSLSDRTAPGIRAWLEAAGANAVLEDVELAGVRGGGARGRARLQWLGFQPVGDRPGLTGLQGTLHGDARGVVFTPDPRARLRFDWPSGFGVAHEVTLAGEVSAWAGAKGWQVHASGLRIDGDGFGADLRGGLWFQGDGTRPRIDLAARLDETRIPAAKGFWVRHRMPARTVEWLDAALAGGRIAGGRALLSGDLDDWPFSAGPGEAATGLFHAEADLVDATLRFQPDWPAAERLQGRVRFIGDGFDFRGKGQLAGVQVEDVEAGIAAFRRAVLSVSARTATGTDVGQVIDLLHGSPLSIDALAGLEAEGALAGSFLMRLPLGSGGGAQVEGLARLDGVRASVQEWDLAFDGVRGELAYDQHGFAARALHAVRDGRPGRLSLAAGQGHVTSPSHAFEGQYRASLDATDLLARAPQLDWLQPHLRGRSTWTASVNVGRAAAGTRAGAAELTLRSDLVGTALDLPVPLHKPAGPALPATVRIPLPLGRGDVSVLLGRRLSLRARTGDGAAAVRVALGGAAARAPEEGLVVEGRAPELAALEWAGLVAAGRDGPGGGSGSSLGLSGVDLEVGNLLLAGGGFGSVHITGTGPDPDTRLRFDGEGLAGSLELPGEGRTALAGHFERMHWQRRSAPEGGQGDGGPPTADSPDPAALPPIRLSVADLRVDGAALGTATLTTSRLADGMHIEQLESQSPTHHVVASGRWTGRGDSARTQMEMRVASADFGSLLEGLGYQGHVRGGDGRLQLSAAWPDGPAGFRAERLDGALQLSLRDGQLVEVEPGAGRLLGLLSIAELPRRLSLDFRDFFERGFAFNRIEGDIRVDSGQASSDSLLMDGPAATIHIAGQADLHGRTYDQTIEVLPKSGNVLTAVGALAGGPVGAAVGAVANAVLRRPLSELGATTYRVTGPWQEPQVDVVRREEPAAAGAGPAPHQ